MGEGTETASCPIREDLLPAAVTRNVGAQAPKPLRLMTARGLAPMAPRDLVTAQFVLTFDPEDTIRAAAEKSLATLDQRIANAVLSDTSLHPEVLVYLARASASDDAYLEKLLLNPSTPPAAFSAVADRCSEQICELIASNQAQLLAEPEIARQLSQNPSALKSTIDRAIDFLVRNGVLLEEVKAFEDAFLRLNGEERLKAANNIDLPTEMVDPSEVRERQFIEDDEDAAENEDVKLSILAKLRTFNVAQKVAAATKGNKTVRTECLRDTNRLVAVAAVTSPKITEPEILAASHSRLVHQEVILTIIRDKKNNWVRNYQVKVALVNNPKTPVPEAVRMVPALNARDLKAVARSRNVAAGVRNRANQIAKGRRANR